MKSGKSVLTTLALSMFVGTGFSPAFASMIDTLNTTVFEKSYDRSHDTVAVEFLTASPIETIITLPAIGNPANASGRPDRVPPINPPIDTPAFYNGLVNTPTLMPASVPSHTLPGSGFGRSVVPVPAAVWLFGSGLLGLVSIARRKKGL
jgi:hypothetical protein